MEGGSKGLTEGRKEGGRKGWGKGRRSAGGSGASGAPPPTTSSPLSDGLLRAENHPPHACHCHCWLPPAWILGTLTLQPWAPLSHCVDLDPAWGKAHPCQTLSELLIQGVQILFLKPFFL